MDLKDNLKKAAKGFWGTADGSAPAQSERKGEDTTGHTVIGAGDVLKGNIRCEGALALFGEVRGDIAVSGYLKLSGRLAGDAAGHTVDVHGGRIIGNITASGHAEVGRSAMVSGNIRAKSLTVNGKVKGDLEVEGTLTIGEAAVVLGKIRVGRIAIVDGAAFQGEVTIHSSDLEALFPQWEAND